MSIELTALAVSTLLISVPYIAGAVGGTISERGGVVNIALEGLMLTGAFTFVAISWWTAQRMGGMDNLQGARAWIPPFAGLLAAIASGVLLSAVHAIATVYYKAENIISGLAINIFALGATNLLLQRVFGSASNSEVCPTFHTAAPFQHGTRLAVFNPVFSPLLLLVILVVIGAHLLIFKTRFGLRLRAVGENPAAADSLGILVSRYRAAGVLLGGVAASLGGVWLANDQGRFTSDMVAGRGYIALAAMIVGKWRPLGAMIACLVFGFAGAMQNILQVARQSGGGTMDWITRTANAVPTQAIQVFPYVLTIIVIAGFIGRSTPPAADGIPFEKEKGV